MTGDTCSSWYTLAELAVRALPGLPTTQSGMKKRADAEGWVSRVAADGSPLARKRAGRGGGLEYHVSLLPQVARVALAAAVPTAPVAPIAAVPTLAYSSPTPVADEPIAATSAAERYEAASAKVKQRARDALAIVQQVEALVAAGVRKTAAIDQTARASGIPASTIYRYFSVIAGAPMEDRLFHLTPRYKGGGREVGIDAELWQVLQSDYLRLSQPTWSSCVRRIEALAALEGKQLPDARTLWRRFEATVHPAVVTFRRKGHDALRGLIPPQERSVAGMRALELVNIDGHTCDVRVRFPDGTIGRPVLIAIQDVMSRKFLAWRYAQSEDAITARLCFADLFRNWGIPAALLADNGRAFACKWLTGGVPTRYRFKVKQDEPLGLMSMLGIEVHWATPYRGQSKPIERGFREFCRNIADHPAFDGAYTGNSPTNKPDNYGERAVEWDDFVRIWDAGMVAHNAQTKRGTEMARGVDSFDAVFDRSFKVDPIRRAKDEHIRLALMAGEQVRANLKDGSVRVLGNRYWCPDLSDVAGDLVTTRFDPEDATQPVHVYAGERLVAVAPLVEMVGFRDAAAGKQQAKLVSDLRKATKARVAALNLLTAHETAQRYAALLPAYEDETPPSAPAVTELVRVRGNTALKPVQQVAAAPAATAAPDFLDSFMAGAARRLRAVD